MINKFLHSKKMRRAQVSRVN